MCTNVLPRKMSNPFTKSSEFLCKNGANCAGKKTPHQLGLSPCRRGDPLAAATVAAAAAWLVCCTAAAVVVATTEADIWKALLLESFLLLSNFFSPLPTLPRPRTTAAATAAAAHRLWWRRADRTVHSGCFGFVIGQEI